MSVTLSKDVIVLEANLCIYLFIYLSIFKLICVQELQFSLPSLSQGPKEKGRELGRKSGEPTENTEWE